MSILNFFHLKGLNEEQKAELQRILGKLYGFTKSCKSNIVDLESDLLTILRNSLKELSKTENINAEEIEKRFNETIKSSLTASKEALERAYQEQLKTKDIFLFDGVVVEKCLNVLRKVLEFQKELDKIYPGSSKKIIESLENILVTVIATQMPILATFIQTSGIFEKVNNIIDHEKLLPKVTRLNDDIKKMRQEIKADKNLAGVYEKAEKVAEISEISKEPIKKIIKVQDNPSNKASLENVLEAAKKIPNSPKEVEKEVSELKASIEKAIPENIKKLPAVKNTLESNLAKTKEELLKAANPETPFAEKIVSLCKAAEHATKIASDVQKAANIIPGGKNLGNLISSIVVSNLVPPPVLIVAKLAPEVASLVGIGKAVITVLNKTQDLNQSQKRSK
ncbi:MAG: hypothetical protein RCO49_03665 [Rickettsia endosymbiont of Argas persicus]